jgi:hypothetical protein
MTLHVPRRPRPHLHVLVSYPSEAVARQALSTFVGEGIPLEALHIEPRIVLSHPAHRRRIIAAVAVASVAVLVTALALLALWSGVLAAVAGTGLGACAAGFGAGWLVHDRRQARHAREQCLRPPEAYAITCPSSALVGHGRW